MTLQIPQDFQDAVEAAIDKNETVLSRITQQQVKEVIGEKYQNYQIPFYLKEYRKQHKPISLQKRFDLLKEEHLSLKIKIQQMIGMIDSESSLTDIKTTLSEAMGFARQLLLQLVHNGLPNIHSGVGVAPLNHRRGNSSSANTDFKKVSIRSRPPQAQNVCGNLFCNLGRYRAGLS
jgi:hypothetical protein